MGGIVDSRRVKVKIRESSFDQRQQSCLSIEINYNFFNCFYYQQH